MANYDPPQPLWKRNAAGILDFLLSLLIFGMPLGYLFGKSGEQTTWTNPAGEIQTTTQFHLTGGATIALIALIVLYFVVLGRTGGTVFQRLFGMRRAPR